jgi:eukaryotic-like serine/threonine-protein kinase
LSESDKEEQALKKFEMALESSKTDLDLQYYGACAFSLASEAHARRGHATRKDKYLDRSLQCLRKLLENEEYRNTIELSDYPDLAPVRNTPQFLKLTRELDLDCRYMAAWNRGFGFETQARYGHDTLTHLEEAQSLATDDYRPLSVSVARTRPDGPSLAASVWHRPIVTDENREDFARRQARALTALIQLGEADGNEWQWLVLSADPQLRSYIVNWAQTFGINPMRLKSKLDESKRTAGSPLPLNHHLDMEKNLFHPETSTRRALILALGRYEKDAIPEDQRNEFMDRLLKVYESDPDAGVHGAAEWTLRRWGFAQRVRAIVERMQGKNVGDQRWFVTSQGQTMSVIEGPVDAYIGAPPTETGGGFTDVPHVRTITRRFAIADRELTLEQAQRFERAQAGGDQSRPAPRFPKSKWPIGNVDWFYAAQYCNWLSDQDHLPKCYVFHADPRDMNDRKTIVHIDMKKNALELDGYRLPTVAEWTYSCRAGTRTSRYYGSSKELLGNYAWFSSNAEEHSHPCGELLPNDLGLFDMLGNVSEWCNDKSINVIDENALRYYDNLSEEMVVVPSDKMTLRGGSFTNAFGVSSAGHLDYPASGSRYSTAGFRVARTLPAAPKPGTQP